jgi:ABC-type multidrug transport system ATPase subunit
MTDRLWTLEQVAMPGLHRPRLDNVSLEIPAGVTAILGESGAGKTSLINLLVKFEHPDRGAVIFHLPGPADRLPVFWVPQDGGLWPHLTAAEHLEAVGAEGGSRLLERFDLGSPADRRNFPSANDRVSQSHAGWPPTRTCW